MKLDKLIKREIIITIVTVIAVSFAFIGLSYAIYMTIGKGETNAVEFGDFTIEMCADTTCADIASNLGNVVGTTVSDNVLVQTQLYPKSDAEALEATPYAFVVKNTGDWNGVINIMLSTDWASENAGSSMITDFDNIKVGYKLESENTPSITELTTNLSNITLFYGEPINVGENKIFYVWVWGSESLSNEAIGKFLVSKISVVGSYLPGDPNNSHSYSKTFAYTGSPQEYKVGTTGTYKIELWGAGGQDSYGGYTSGIIPLTANERLYFYVGGESSTVANGVVFNAGTASNGMTPGAGATDVRLTNGAWNDDASLDSRIMVAAGSGSDGANAGGLLGYDGNGAVGGTQTSGIFGIGNSGGGGYYGGASATSGASGGGSSYISGHAGCIAINDTNDRNIKSGCNANSTSVECSTHYSDKLFTNTVMIDGTGYNWTSSKGNRAGMPTPDGGVYPEGTGRTGNGYAKITKMVYLTLELNGGIQSKNYNGYYAPGEKIELEIPTRRVDSEFLGWEILSGTGYAINGNILTIGSTDATVQTMWGGYINLIIDSAGGIYSGETTTTLGVEKTTTIPYPTREGFGFAGWTISGTNSTISGNTLSVQYADTTLTANWINESTFTYTGNYTFTLDPINWRLKLLSSGTFTSNNELVVDEFLVGGGANYVTGEGGASNGYGGYSTTVEEITLISGQSYNITIGGATAATTGFTTSVNGGTTGWSGCWATIIPGGYGWECGGGPGAGGSAVYEFNGSSGDRYAVAGGGRGGNTGDGGNSSGGTGSGIVILRKGQK